MTRWTEEGPISSPMDRYGAPSGGRVSFSDVFQHLGGMPLGFHLGVEPEELTRRVEYEGRAHGPHGHLAVELFLSPGAQGLQHGCVRVRQQGVSQLEFFRKFPVGFDRVLADPCEVKSCGVELSGEFPELARFGRSAGSVVLGVNEEHQSLGPGQIGKLPCFSRLIPQMPLRVRGTDIQHGSTSIRVEPYLKTISPSPIIHNP
jgi:hypothetical protein